MTKKSDDEWFVSSDYSESDWLDALDKWRGVATDGHVDIATGEVLGTPEFRVKDTFAKCFTISPKKTPLREYGFDVDEYITKEGEGEMTISMIEV